MAYPQPPKIVYPAVQGNGIFVQLDSYGGLATSLDGITYGSPSQPFTSIDAHWIYNGITFGAGLFLAFGNHIAILGSGLPGKMWQSTIITGANWITCDFNVTASNRWFLVDDEGRTATSAGMYPGSWTFTRAIIPIVPQFLDTDGLFI